jgi:hypothetical protein
MADNKSTFGLTSIRKPLTPLQQDLAMILADILVSDVQRARSIPHGDTTESRASD